MLYSIIEENRKNRWSKCAPPEHQLIKIRRAFSEGMPLWAYAVKVATCVYEGAPKSPLPGMHEAETRTPISVRIEAS